MNRSLPVCLLVILISICGTAQAAYDPSYIRNWLICGPFENSKLETVLIAGESVLAPKAGDLSSGKTWKEYDSVENAVDFEEKTAFGQQELCAAYAYVEIDSPVKRRATMRVHSDDAVKIWLNGVNILTNDIARGMAEEDILTIILQPGKNRLLTKVKDYFAGWMLSVRITDEEGNAIKDLKFNPRPVPLERLPVKKIWASSVQGGDLVQYSPKFAVDPDKNSRWSSEHYDPQFLILDFGSVQEIKRMDILWENAYSKSYKIEVSDDKLQWKEVFSTKEGTGGKDIIPLSQPQKGRYLRLLMLEKGTEWGNSIWDMAVYGFVPEGTTPVQETAIGETEVEMVKPMQAVAAAASSFQKPNPEKNETFDAKNAIDGDLKTRWSSQFTDPQWIYADLGAEKRIDSVTLAWETAHAKSYSLDISDDATNWKTIYSTDSSKGDHEDIILEKPQQARYVRVFCKERARKEWGYSLWEIEIFGE